MADIRYNFIQSGAGEVENAFLSIGTAAVRTARDVEEAFRGMVAAARAAARGIGRELEQGAERGAEAVRRAGEKEVRQTVRTEQERVRTRRTAEEQAAREAEKAAAKRLKAEEAFAKASKKISQQRAEDEARMEREKASIAEKSARERARAEDAVRSRRAKNLGVIGDAIKGGMLGALTAGYAGVFGAVGTAARDELKLQEAAQRISINSRQAGQEGVDATTLRREFEATAIATPGINAGDVADAVQRFVTLTGDLDTARKGQGTFATVASATGANIGEVAEASASLSNQFDVKGIEDMREALAALTFQGKAGAFELRDMAAMFQRLAASGGAFGLEKSVQGVKTLGGLTQIARTGTGNAEQATTAVENIFTNLKVKAEELKGEGVSVYKDGKVRDVRQILVEAIAKVGGTDIEKKQAGLSSIFGEQGIRAINPLVSRYNDAFRAAKGTDPQKQAAAMAAITEQLQLAIDAPGDWAEVVKDAATAQEMNSAKLGAAWEQLKVKVGNEVVPALAQLLPKIAESVEALDPFIEAIGLAGDALVAVVDYLKDAGFIATQEKTHAEKAADAQKQLDQMDAERKIGPLTAEQEAKREAIVNQAKQEKSLSEASAKELYKPLSLDEFAIGYAARANPENQNTPAAVAKGLSLAASLTRDPADSLASNDFLQRLSGETQAQRDWRHNFQGQTTAGQSIEGSKEAEMLKANLEALTNAAQSATRAFDAAAQAIKNTPTVPRPTIVPT